MKKNTKLIVFLLIILLRIFLIGERCIDKICLIINIHCEAPCITLQINNYVVISPHYWREIRRRKGKGDRESVPCLAEVFGGAH